MRIRWALSILSLHVLAACASETDPTSSASSAAADSVGAAGDPSGTWMASGSNGGFGSLTITSTGSGGNSYHFTLHVQTAPVSGDLADIDGEIEVSGPRVIFEGSDTCFLTFDFTRLPSAVEVDEQLDCRGFVSEPGAVSFDGLYTKSAEGGSSARAHGT
jgi:hypothetical protein